MSTLTDLYQDVLLDHSRNPRNREAMPECRHHATGDNPLCGDHIEVYVDLDAGGVLRRVTFAGSGCALATASASLMTGVVAGKNVEETSAVLGDFRTLILEGTPVPPALLPLAGLAGVHAYPARVKCALLPWYALRAALAGSAGQVSTE